MERELRTHLLDCGRAFAAARSIELSTLGRLAVNDGTFFERITNHDKTFTAKIYDRAISWMSLNWPEGAVWPVDVPRPLHSHSEIAA